jgi:NAD(P)-dependent dehydrogenase (short-subunit alcohol dehydrogenase family)
VHVISKQSLGGGVEGHVVDVRGHSVLETLSGELSGRAGEPGEIAQAHIHLMQDGYITGAVVPVVGGARLA